LLYAAAFTTEKFLCAKDFLKFSVNQTADTSYPAI